MRYLSNISCNVLLNFFLTYLPNKSKVDEVTALMENNALSGLLILVDTEAGQLEVMVRRDTRLVVEKGTEGVINRKMTWLQVGSGYDVKEKIFRWPTVFCFYRLQARASSLIYTANFLYGRTVIASFVGSKKDFL